MPSPVVPSSFGLIAAPFTPLHADGALNLEAIGPCAAALHRNQVTAAFVCGTTGEGSSLTLDERQQVAARWRKEKPATLGLFVHVGHNTLSDSQQLARHAASIGADAIATLAPGFFRPASLTDLVDWCTAIAAAAPGVPFYYYHMPAMTGANFAMADFLPLVIERIPTFAGIKFTHENLFDYALTVAAAGPRHAILFGRDEILLGALALGATGAVGSTYNYMAPIFTRLIAAFQSGQKEEALREQLLAQAIIAIMARHGGLAAGKAIMGLIGLDCGPVRPPLTRLGPAQIAILRDELAAAGFFQAINQASGE